ncbi:MAG: hypothetical protein J0I94_00430 [Thiobacillus sp.]|nr:hypothetical protein [Thiobacillus sp.]
MLARLIEHGSCIESARNRALIRRYETAGWLMSSNRHNDWLVRAEAMLSIRTRLTTLLPSWEADFELLRAHELDPRKSQDIEALPVLRRPAVAKGKLNRRNWRSAAGLGPKRKSMLNTQATLTSDWVMRLRPNKGLLANWEDSTTDLWEMAQTWTECLIPQRKWLSLNEFVGAPPKIVITCENLGAYIDLPLPENSLALFSPGKHSELAIELLAKLPASRWVHFGDLDPVGLDIANHIANETGRKVFIYIPSFAMEYVSQGMAQKKGVIWNIKTEHPVLKALEERKEGLYQEVFMLDCRLKSELIEL